MANNNFSPEELQKFRDQLDPEQKKALYDLDYDKGHVMNEEFDKRQKEIEGAKTVIAEQEEIKKRAEEAITGITGSPISPKEANETPKIKGRMLKINSDSWTTIEEKNGVRAKTNGKGVWEFIEGKFKGEQIFTQDATKREAKNNNMRVPEKDELIQIIQSINPNIDPNKGWQDDNTKPSIKDTLGVKLASSRNPDGYFNVQGKCGYLWSATEGYYVSFDETQVYPGDEDDPSCAFSVFVVEN